MTIKKYLFLSPSDLGLTVAGLLFAVSSVAFAAIMIAKEVGHPLFYGVDHLMLFAQPFRSTDHERTIMIEKPSVDFQMTGAIDSFSRMQPTHSQKEQESTMSLTGTDSPYRLQVASDGVVYIENGSEKIIAREGVFVPGQGRILLVEKRAGHWIVVTTQGVLLEAAS